MYLSQASFQDELRAVMHKMGQSPTAEELDGMFKAADKDGDGNIDFQGDTFSYLGNLIWYSFSKIP